MKSTQIRMMTKCLQIHITIHPLTKTPEMIYTLIEFFIINIKK
jgi:hypothetical protein